MIMMEYPKASLEGMTTEEKLMALKRQVDILTDNLQIVLNSLEDDIKDIATPLVEATRRASEASVEVIAKVSQGTNIADITVNGQLTKLYAPTATSDGDKHYVHNQQVPSASWAINHNLGKEPSVTVVDSAGHEVVGSYTYPTKNSVVLEFNSAFSGKAYLN